MVSDFFATLSYVGAAPKHALISYDAHSEIINGTSMVLTTHYFRGHVTWSATSVLSVLFTPHSGNAKIC